MTPVREVTMTMVKVCIDYEFGIDLDANSLEEFDEEFNKLRGNYQRRY